jgi:hypothetical protein
VTFVDQKFSYTLYIRGSEQQKGTKRGSAQEPPSHQPSHKATARQTRLRRAKEIKSQRSHVRRQPPARKSLRLGERSGSTKEKPQMIPAVAGVPDRVGSEWRTRPKKAALFYLARVHDRHSNEFLQPPLLHPSINRQNPASFAAQLDRFFFTFAEQIVILAIFHFYLNC